MKKLLLLIAVSCAATAQAQDVIVKRDGSTILTKVLEVNQSDIKYKKFSNQSGPTYTINKSEVMAINYEGGDKDTFEETTSVANSINPNSSGQFGVNPNLNKDNLQIVQEFNQRQILLKNGVKSNEAFNLLGILGMEEGSIIETPQLKASFVMKKYVAGTKGLHARVDEENGKILNIGDKLAGLNGMGMEENMLVVVLTNKTDKTIYVDLANCFVIQDGQARPYYVPTSTTVTSANSSGGSVNVGAVAGAVGVGGSLGSFANGINVGGGLTKVSSQTTYSQRIVSVPPLSSLSLDPQRAGISMYYIGGMTSTYKVSSSIVNQCIPFFVEKGILKEKKKYYEFNYGKVRYGEVIDIPKPSGIAPLSVHITYAMDEQLTLTQSLRAAFYLRQVMGCTSVRVLRYDLSNLDLSNDPLLYMIRGDRILK